MPASGSSSADVPLSGTAGAASPARRSFLAALLALGTASVGALLTIPLVRFVLHPLLRSTTPTSWSEVGRTDGFSAASSPVKKLITVDQRDGWRKIVSEKAVYVVRRASGEIEVFSSVCPHLGCSVAWRGEMAEFICPCHNGSFAADGKLISGPPPRGLDRLESKIESGVLKVHYQYFRQLVSEKEVVA